jgi:Mg-chelatase subunit ChlD
MLSFSPRRAGAGAWLVMFAVACGARSELEVPDPIFCSSSIADAEPSQLDVIFLVDSSGSMDLETPLGTVKWAEVTEAIGLFLAEPSLAGTGVAVVFFPEVNPDVPDVCATDADCGEPDACRPIAVCAPSYEVLCDTDERCTDLGYPGETCEQLGRCQGAQSLCLLGEDPSLFCGSGVACVPFAVCDNESVCEAAAYHAGDLVTLPQGAAAIEAALAGRVLEGGTPTLPAVTGAIESARLRSEAHPRRKPIVVLATDGLPTRCDDDLDPFEPEAAYNVSNVVEAVAAGAEEGIQTFVVGVFDPELVAISTPNLDAIAQAGSGRAAFIVNTADEVAPAFLEALRQLRREAGRCVFTASWSGGDDPAEVWVRASWNGAALTLAERADAEACAHGDGFYFETHPTQQSDAVRFALCPKSCERGEPSYVELAVRCRRDDRN